MLRLGIYEQLIDRRLAQELDQLPENQKATAAIDQAEASSVLSQYVADVVRKALERMHDGKSELPDQVALVNQLVAMIGEVAEEDIDGISVDERAQQLLALIGDKDPRIALGKSAKDVVRPETSLAQSSLFTGAVHEPQMFSELKKEIVSADHIDMLVSFIKWSGLRLIMEELTEFTQRGVRVAVLEAERVGSGQTKNTTAKITSQHGQYCDAFIKCFGLEAAQCYAQANQEAIETYAELITRKKIDCAFIRTQSYV